MVNHPRHRQTPPSLLELSHGRALPKPEKALKGRSYCGTWQVLIAWHGLSDSETTCKPVSKFKSLYVAFQLEDELFPHGGRDVMVGLTYHRRTQPVHDPTSPTGAAAGPIGSVHQGVGTSKRTRQ